MTRLYNFRYSWLTMLLIVATSVFFSACKEDDPDTGKPVKEISILLYAVASNNLSDNFFNDRQEICDGLREMDLDRMDFFIYSVTPTTLANAKAELSRAVRKPDGTIEFIPVKTYDRLTYSTDPDRISQVMRDYTELSEADTRGLFLWSHSTAWFPTDSDHIVPDIPAYRSGIDGAQPADIPELFWFGQDSFNGKSDFCNIEDLACVIPDNFFDFIWWDCCYMSSIEVLYQFRDKAPFMVAYPTEVVAEGAPYDEILPFILKQKPNLIAAADAMASYMKAMNNIFTIAVIDMSAIEEVAQHAKEAIPGKKISQVYLQKYSRGSYFFYDFGQYIRTRGENVGDGWDCAAFREAMDRLVIYKASSDILFDRRPVAKENFSGVSTYYFDYNPEFEIEPEEEYYMTLDWYKRIYD